MSEGDAEKQESRNIKTRTIYVKRGHKLYDYFIEIGKLTNNLYNTTNYFVRQSYFGFIHRKNNPQIEGAINYINDVLPRINVKRTSKTKGNGRLPKEFNSLSSDNPFINVRILDSVFRFQRNVDFIALPAHTNYIIMQEVFECWKGYFESLRRYKQNPSIFSGRPKPPKYSKKGSIKTMSFSNQTCTIQKDGKTLRFPKTKNTLNVGKLFEEKIQSIKEIKVKLEHGQFKVEIVVELPYRTPQPLNKERAIGIDLGVNNFAVISNNIDEKPIIIDGKPIKHINHIYNKSRAKYYSIIRTGKKKSEGVFNTRRLDSITLNRNRRIKDYMHKTSNAIINYCVENDIGVIVIGNNPDWKKNVRLHKKNKQSFIQIPYSQFINFLTYKGIEVGINVTTREESYTSKSSFLDNDIIPTYNAKKKEKHTFSGVRKKRGLYISSDGTKLNADVNGSYNILRKEIGYFQTDNNQICNPTIVKKVSSGCHLVNN